MGNSLFLECSILKEYLQHKDCVAPREVRGTDPRAGQEPLRILELTPEAVFLQKKVY